MELKRCTKCGENKPNTNEYFYFQNKSKGTLRSRCKVCNNDKDKGKEYYENNKDKILKYKKKYYENNKDKLKKCRENNKDKIRERDKKYRENNKDKIREYRENNKEYYKEYRENNKEHYKDLFKKYYENNKDKYKEYNHKRRALELGNGGSYTKAQWLDTLEYFDYKCAYTGECIKHNCHVEHIVPLSKGGTSYIWNLVPSTERANLSKQSRDMEEWYREQEYFCEERLNKIYEYQKYMSAKYK